jgi:ferredoxin
MSLKITNECINCGACEQECPNNAIYEGGIKWNLEEGTKFKGILTYKNKQYVSKKFYSPIKQEIFYIVPAKCTECVGFHETPQCASVCPVDCCIVDNENKENTQELLLKNKILHNKKND